jgi:hypothetical protein
VWLTTLHATLARISHWRRRTEDLGWLTLAPRPRSGTASRTALSPPARSSLARGRPAPCALARAAPRFRALPFQLDEPIAVGAHIPAPLDLAQIHPVSCSFQVSRRSCVDAWHARLVPSRRQSNVRSIVLRAATPGQPAPPEYPDVGVGDPLVGTRQTTSLSTPALPAVVVNPSLAAARWRAFQASSLNTGVIAR